MTFQSQILVPGITQQDISLQIILSCYQAHNIGEVAPLGEDVAYGKMSQGPASRIVKSEEHFLFANC